MLEAGKWLELGQPKDLNAIQYQLKLEIIKKEPLSDEDAVAELISPVLIKAKSACPGSESPG